MIAPADAAVSSPAMDRVQQLQQSISPSRLSVWLQCRLKFYFRYVLNLVRPTTSARHVGSVAHAVLQQWNLARWRREPFDPERARSVFDAQWTELQQGQMIRWENPPSVERDSAWRTLVRYFAATPIRADERPEAIEVWVETDLSLHGLPRLIGVLDLVRAGGIITDFKVTGKSPTQVGHLNEIQLTAYSVMYRDATGRGEGGQEVHHLVRTKTPKLIVTPLPPAQRNQRTRLFRQIESYVNGLDRRDFVPSPGFHCAGCEYLAECRKWS
jgi:hypothetical protein